MDAIQVSLQFETEGNPVACARFGEGHINETYKVDTDAGKCYVMQKLNARVFQNIPGLMANMVAVTRHIRQTDPDPRHTLRLVPTVSGADYYIDAEGGSWRMCHYVENSICLQRAESAEEFGKSGVAFGRFQRQLAGFPAETLAETIPHFHDTPARFRHFKEAVARDAMGRAASVQEEIDRVMAHEAEAGYLMERLANGTLPLRVTHNDTKLNNVMFDEETRQPLCVIDLDTVMPGLAANDFGDSIRFGASTATEDETDLAKVNFSLPYYEAYTRGFLSQCGDSLTPAEIQSLPMGAKLMTLECGLRFLMDYINGDIYFKIARPQHNLDRCRTQLALVDAMEANWREMEEIVRRAMG